MTTTTRTYPPFSRICAVVAVILLGAAWVMHFSGGGDPWDLRTLGLCFIAAALIF